MLVLLLACAGKQSDSDTLDGRAACIADNPGSDYGGADLASLSEQCGADGGTNCADTWITEAAALCIAEIEGLPTGIADWRANLLFHSTFLRVSWSVSSTEESVTDSYGTSSSGTSFLIDGTNGELLQESQWEAQP